MQKEELLQLLHDPDICQEIFLIIKNGGKPSTPTDVNKFSAVMNQLNQANSEKLAGGADKLKTPLRVTHIAELLAEAL